MRESILDVQRLTTDPAYAEEVDSFLEKTFAYRYTGELEFYFETGMEGQAPCLHDNRGLTLNPNPQKGSPKYYRSQEYLHSIGNGDFLKVFAKNGTLIFAGLLLKDRRMMASTGYSYGFIPQDVNFFKQWHGWFSEELQGTVYSHRPIPKEDPKIQEYYRKLREKHPPLTT